MHVLIVGQEPDALLNFRGDLIKDIIARGHKVTCAVNCGDGTIGDELDKIGAAYVPVRFDRAGMNPFADTKTLFQLIQIFKVNKPDIVFLYQIKPVIYGGIAARVYKNTKIFSMIEGLGHVFIEPDKQTPKRLLLKRLSCFLYKLSLQFSRQVFFLNPDDRNDFVNMGLVKREKTVLLNGIGVDLNRYTPEPIPPHAPVFLLIARLIKEKGVSEFVAAAKRIKEKFPQARFLLAGALDANPSSVSAELLEQWQKEGVVEYLGFLTDIREAIKQCSVFVLPSYYREGVPRTALESMAMGRPLIVTNAPGCRETILLEAGTIPGNNRASNILGENGFLVPVKDIDNLVEAMEYFILSPPDIAEAMGKISRNYCVEKFDVHLVNETIMNVLSL